jgi:hypothetical protein
LKENEKTQPQFKGENKCKRGKIESECARDILAYLRSGGDLFRVKGGGGGMIFGRKRLK